MHVYFLIILSSVFILPEVKSNSNMEKRIVWGRPVRVGRYPFLAALFHGTAKRPKGLCGASLVNERWLVTAAHCMEPNVPRSEYTVYLGAVDLDYSYQDHVQKFCYARRGISLPNRWTKYAVKLDKIVMHPEFETSELRNDIALIRMEKSVPMGRHTIPYVNPVSLNKPENYSFPTVADVCYAMGWGCVFKEHLKIRFWQTLAHEAGFVRMSSTTSGHCSNNTAICMGGLKSRHGCPGDSGSPLVCWSHGQWLQVGVLSGTVYTYTIFTAIATFSNWISQIIAENN